MGLAFAMIGAVFLILALGFAFFEYKLTCIRQGYGLIMPVGFFAIGVFAIIRSIPTVIESVTAEGGTVGEVLLSLLISFVVICFPAAWVYVVHFFTCRRLGLTPWPFKK